MFGHFMFATSSSLYASGVGGLHMRGGSKTIEDLLDVSGRDEVDAKVVRFLYVCSIPSNVLLSPY